MLIVCVEFDVNLFDEDDLYDVNTIGSLFKAWLRELPEDVFPQQIQDRLSERHGSEETAPLALQDELSNLPPWNYYLLFAITCHLSLLTAYAEKNKMSYHNLYVCFAPALKMNGDCFRWLVADWRNCWRKGCLTEKAALEHEYRTLDNDSAPVDEVPYQPVNGGDLLGPSNPTMDTRIERQDSTVATSRATDRQQGQAWTDPEPESVRSSSPLYDTDAPVGENVPRAANYTQLGSNDLTVQPNTPSHLRSPSQLPELSFPQPISPIFSYHK